MAQEHDQELDLSELPTNLEVQFTLPDAGWINCQVSPLHVEPEIFCSHIYDPFKGFVAWLEQIVAGADAATWTVNEEGSVTSLRWHDAAPCAQLHDYSPPRAADRMDPNRPDNRRQSQDQKPPRVS